MIRIFTFFLATSVSLILFSCKDEQTMEIEKGSPKEIDFSRFSPFNLRPYGINADMQLPDSTTVYGASNEWRIVHQLDGFTWELVLAEDFHILIEDWGQEDGIQHYINEITSEKQKASKFTVLEKSDSFLSYTESPSAGNTEQEKVHLFQQSNIDGINYVIRTNNKGCSQETAPLIKTALKSMEN
jgi:hypothetical protein